jgi:hypothetical protein
MKGSLVKLNFVSTLLGKAQIVIFYPFLPDVIEGAHFLRPQIVTFLSVIFNFPMWYLPP